MSKWDATAAIVNEIRSHLVTINREYRQYGIDGPYGDIHRIIEMLKDQQAPQGAQNRIMLLYRDWAPLAIWNERKEVYTMHPRMSIELGATAIDDTIPASVLQRLPHPNPLFVLPSGIDITHTDRSPGRIKAIHVSGAIISDGEEGYSSLTSTVDERANGLHLTTIAEVLDEHGTVIDWDYCHTSIRTSNNFTIGQAITKDRAITSITGTGAVAMGMDEASLGYIRKTTGIAIAHLLYVSSRSAEIAEPRKATGARIREAQRRGQEPLKPIRHRPVGYVIGAAIDAYDRIDDKSTTSGDGAGRTVRPHTRRGHFHTVRYGKGRALSYVDWFPPIPVNVNGPAKMPTLHEYGSKRER